MLKSLAAIALSAAVPVAAAAGPSPVGDTVARAALIEGWRQPDGSRVAAIEIRLDPGWHTYWRVPGEAGIPPDFDWSGSANLASVSYEWPRPTRFESFGLETLGYADTVVLPVRLTPKDPAAPMELAVAVSYGVCSDICVPAEARLAASIGPGAPEQGRDRIEAALAERPRTPAEAGVARVSCTLAPAPDGFEITAAVTFAADPAPGQRAVIESAQPGLWIGSAETSTEGRTVTARAPIEGAGTAGPMLERRALRVTVLDAGRAVDIHGCQTPG